MTVGVVVVLSDEILENGLNEFLAALLASLGEHAPHQAAVTEEEVLHRQRFGRADRQTPQKRLLDIGVCDRRSVGLLLTARLRLFGILRHALGFHQGAEIGR